MNTGFTPKTPIVSHGVIVCRLRAPAPGAPLRREYLMICRKHSFGYTDFMRGKYALTDIPHIRTLLHEMSESERQQLLAHSFADLCAQFWRLPSIDVVDVAGSTVSFVPPTWFDRARDDDSAAPGLGESHKSTSSVGSATSSNKSPGVSVFCSDKFDALRRGVTLGAHTYTLEELVAECTADWPDPEWEFPKGRRNAREREQECALREFEEETGIPHRHLFLIDNILPVEEQFLGSNHKHYRHKYFLAMWNQPLVATTQIPAASGHANDRVWSLASTAAGTESASSAATANEPDLSRFQTSEVSKLEWKTLEECLQSIRPYHHEKRELIQTVDAIFREYLPAVVLV